jgi:hypothetical protein
LLLRRNAACRLARRGARSGLPQPVRVGLRAARFAKPDCACALASAAPAQAKADKSLGKPQKEFM